MDDSPKSKPYAPPDWDTLYREGTPGWETGTPAPELVRTIDEGVVPPGTTLEIGCGTGADAIHLARCGFEVTGVDCSPLAIERARSRGEMDGAAVRFVLGDVFKFVESVEPFDFIYDAGFYHFSRTANLGRYLDLLWRTTRPGSFCLTLAGSTGETAEGGPPQVSEDEIRSELGRLFEFVHVRPFQFESPHRKAGFLGWSCLMRRPQVAQ